MGFPAARVGDPHICPMFDGPKPHVGGPVLPPGKPTVLIGGSPAATVGDRCFCASAPDVIVQGSTTVFINNMMASRQFDRTAHGGMILMGCPTVLIGGPSIAMPPALLSLMESLRDYLEFGLGVAVGFGEGLWETVKGLYQMLRHPIDTITGIVNLAGAIIDKALDLDSWIALTKKETWVGLKDGIERIIDEYEKAPPYEKGKIVGRAIEFVAELAVPVTKAKVAGNAAKAGKAVDIAQDVDKVGDAVRAAGGIEKKAVAKGISAIDDVTYEEFKRSVKDFDIPGNEHHAKHSYELYKDRNFKDLESYFNEHELNKASDGNVYPPNHGAVGKPRKRVVEIGEEFDRFGNEQSFRVPDDQLQPGELSVQGGRYVSHSGTPFEERALPPSKKNEIPKKSVAEKPFHVWEAEVMPWFGQKGGGVQQELPVSVDKLKREGFLK